MTCKYYCITTILIFLFSFGNLMAENLHTRYRNLALQGSIASLVPELENPPKNLTEKEQQLVRNFSKRFGPNSEPDIVNTKWPLINDVVLAYHDYWKKVLLQNYSEDEREKMIYSSLREVLIKHSIHIPDSTDVLAIVADEFEKCGVTALTGKTLPHFDLLAWAKNDSVEYKVQLTDCSVDVIVFFMSDFVSYGWSHYATFGSAYPGGWATSEALYCMGDDYDRESEKFKVSYLQHEGRHFADYKQFPNLKSADLEYRAKLTELVFADTTLYQIIEKFIANSKRQKDAPHSLANNEVIKQLSMEIFNKNYIIDIAKWKGIDKIKIHSVANKLLEKSTQYLILAGAETTEGLIKP